MMTQFSRYTSDRLYSPARMVGHPYFYALNLVSSSASACLSVSETTPLCVWVRERVCTKHMRMAEHIILTF